MLEIETMAEQKQQQQTEKENTADSTDKLAGCLKLMLFQIVYPQRLPNALELTVTDAQLVRDFKWMKQGTEKKRQRLFYALQIIELILRLAAIWRFMRMRYINTLYTRSEYSRWQPNKRGQPAHQSLSLSPPPLPILRFKHSHTLTSTETLMMCRW